MKKIGLVLSYKETNYGAQLQAFATQYLIDSFGLQSEIIEYSPKRGDRHIVLSFGLFSYLYHSFIFRKRVKQHTVSDDPLFIRNRQEREKQYKSFIKRRLHDVVKVSGYSELEAKGKELDAVLIGSDQKWLPGFSFGNFTSLRFVPDNVRKISYATSLGVSEYPKYCWSTSRKAWKRIDFLSVREEQGASIIKQICGEDTNVQVVLDPTYLLTSTQWKELIPVKEMREKPYILCYYLGNDESSKIIARRFADEKGLPLVSILSKESYSAIDQTFADELVVGNSPEDFVNWIRGAEYILTDSFHGTAFSIINEKQFFTFYRKRKEASSRNSRIDNILDKLGLKERLVLPGLEHDYMCHVSEINYAIVSAVVDKERNHSLSFLKKALQFNDNK